MSSINTEGWLQITRITNTSPHYTKPSLPTIHQ